LFLLVGYEELIQILQAIYHRMTFFCFLDRYFKTTVQ
jgi:hypothetical protein